MCKVLFLLCHLVPYGLTACTKMLEHMQDTEDISNTGWLLSLKICYPTLDTIAYLIGLLVF